MDLFLSVIQPDGSEAMAAIEAANTQTSCRGLVLSPEQTRSLCAVYKSAVTDNGIVEFGAGGVVKIQKAFATSDFVDASNFAEVVEAMTEAFYFIKREVTDEICDDTVIAAMLRAFDSKSMGSLELFEGRELETLIRYLNEGRTSLDIAGLDDYDTEPEYDSPYGADDEW